MAVFLARESRPAGAVARPAGAGRFARMDAAAAGGYPRPDDGTPATGDAANWAAADDEASCYVPKGMRGWSARYMSHLFGKEGSR